MEITVEEIELGDEILILSQAPKLIRILKVPELGKPSQYAPLIPRYKAVKGVTAKRSTIVARRKWCPSARSVIMQNINITTYLLISPDDNDLKQTFDLNYKKLWLVKRNNI